MKKLIISTVLSVACAFTASAQNTTVTIHANQGKNIINKEIYNKKERGDAIFILIILILYFSFPILFIIKSKYEEKKKSQVKN